MAETIDLFTFSIDRFLFAKLISSAVNPGSTNTHNKILPKAWPACITHYITVFFVFFFPKILWYPISTQLQCLLDLG